MVGQQASWRTNVPLLREQRERNADKEECEYSKSILLKGTCLTQFSKLLIKFGREMS